MSEQDVEQNEPRDEYPAVRGAGKRRMLAALKQTGNIALAAQVAGVARRSHYNWLGNDPDYAAAAADAREQAAEMLEEEARRRAVEGVRRPVLYRGKPVMVPSDWRDPDSPKVPAYTVRYSDALLMFLLKAAMPEKYRENYRGPRTKGHAAAQQSPAAGLIPPEWFMADGGAAADDQDEPEGRPN